MQQLQSALGVFALLAIAWALSENRRAVSLKQAAIGLAVTLLTARAGVVKRLSLTGRADPRPIITLRIESASELRRGWLGRDV